MTSGHHCTWPPGNDDNDDVVDDNDDANDDDDASQGRLDVVEWLLREAGASVHARDREDGTPLMSAVVAGHRDVVEMLVRCGGHLADSPARLGDRMVTWAGQGRMEQVRNMEPSADHNRVSRLWSCHTVTWPSLRLGP